ncbi:pseudouridine synthase [Shewanella litorisediminis]|uniref:Pseudouridine synthase n=1 Tax=Shewanella litorisediminis TaxID=1173586 RepID=A0ABX7G4W5_9GAMM|nr:pseudouridine synthase [Shewanella litorisediminis]MCL2917865.1 pseudouridine synthase [Shewanella litorisediminis]QRH02302.1 pseudouridine synthase [Shewanella litorisediminis]
MSELTATARAAQPSYVVLPRDNPSTTVFGFLCSHFARIGEAVWRTRILDGKVHWQDGSLIDLDTPYRATARVYYYREVVAETKIPFSEKILCRNEHMMLVFKPHFLPVTPSGNYVNECLVHRLRLATGIDTISPAHRLDRETAGVILMSLNPETRHQYHQLFLNGGIRKDYEAIARLTPELLALHGDGQGLPQRWTVKNRMQPADPSFLMQVVPGEANSHSEIALLKVKDGRGLFELSPITGRTHQLRVHMQSLGMPLENDRFYPSLQPQSADNFDTPLKLVARRLRFTDPITGEKLDVGCDGFAGEFS